MDLFLTHLSWQGGVVLGLLFLSIFLAQVIKSFPRDLTFTIVALLTPLFGVVSSKELCNAGVNQVILTVLGLWMMGKACEHQGLFHLLKTCLHRYFPTWTASNSTPMRVKWKTWVTPSLFLGAIAATFFAVPVGTAFFAAGLLLLLFHPFPIRKAFREEFPLPLLLWIFSASIFFTAMQNSGLSSWIASLLSF